MAINWAKNLEKLSRKESNEPVGGGWFTAREFKENTKIGHCRSYRILKDGVTDGSILIFKGSAWNQVHKQNTRSVWYKFKDPK